MRNVIETIFGSYIPVTTTDLNGVTVVASGMSGVDWTFIMGVALFGICLFCLFAIIGAVVKK